MEDSKSGTDFQELPMTIQKARKTISSIWILPVIAAFMGIFLIYKGVVDHPIDVVINFRTAEGIAQGKTKVLYKGLTVGEVKQVTINPDLESMDVHVAFDVRSESLLKKDSLFWLVTPRIKATEITGLETIMTGNYIRMRPKSGEPARNFKALDEPPPIDKNEPGLHLTLTSEILPSIQIGSYIYYENLEVGDVQSFNLSKDQKKFKVKIHIKPEYTTLVTKQSRFWDISGIAVEGNLSGFRIKTRSIAAIIKGGLSFYTPKGIKDPKPAENNDEFKIYPDFNSSHSGISIVVRFPTSDGIIPDKTKIKYKGIDVGYVHEITVLEDLSAVNVHVYMDPRTKPYLGRATQFWLVKPKVGITGVSGLETLFTGFYIGIKPKKGPLHKNFVALGDPPLNLIKKETLNITLKADRRGSLKSGSPVSYRQVKVGEVKGFELSKTADSVDIHVSIQKKYMPLVRENSRFWITSGVEFGLFTGLKTESIESVLAGGLAFATPDNDDMAKTAENGAQFILYEKPMEVWFYWKPKINLEL